MKSLLCVSFVLLFAATVSAQFNKNSPARNGARATDATERKPAEKGPDRATKAADQANAEAELENALLAAMDTDHDGVVTKIELTKAMAALRKAQARKDKSTGNITFDKPADANAADPAVAGGADQTQGGAGAGGPGAGRGNEMVARFMQYDRNRDGRLTPDEVPTQARAMLQGADLDGDGAISPAELQALSARMGERMRALGAGAGTNGGAGVPSDGGGRKPPRENNN